MVQILVSGISLQYNENTIVLGAQTVRPGDAEPVRALLRGTTSPAAFVSQLVRQKAATSRRTPKVVNAGPASPCATIPLE